MGIIHQGILGAVSGKIGPVVGGSWKGIPYLRGYQQQVAQPNTALQIAQKTKLSTIVFLAKNILTQMIKPLNDRFAVRMSGYNLFVKRNIGFVSNLGVFNYSLGILCEGTLTAIDSLSITSANASPLLLATWVDNTGTGTALSTDAFYAFGYNTTNEEVGFSAGINSRADAATVITFPVNNTTADVIECYAAFRKANGFAVSNSEYQQVITV